MSSMIMHAHVLSLTTILLIFSINFCIAEELFKEYSICVWRYIIFWWAPADQNFSCFIVQFNFCLLMFVDFSINSCHHLQILLCFRQSILLLAVLILCSAYSCFCTFLQIGPIFAQLEDSCVLLCIPLFLIFLPCLFLVVSFLLLPNIILSVRLLLFIVLQRYMSPWWVFWSR